VTPDLDALLTALHVEIGDRVISSGRRPGQPKKSSDAELVCLAVAQAVVVAATSEWGAYGVAASLACQLGPPSSRSGLTRSTVRCGGKGADPRRERLSAAPTGPYTPVCDLPPVAGLGHQGQRRRL
jgi:hypothetical protein